MILKKTDQGFTLIEIMITMLILSIGILGISAMQIHAISDNSYGMDLTECATLGQNKLEQLLAIDYNDATLNDTDGDGTGQDTNNDGIDNSGNNFGLGHNTTGTADFNETNGNYTIFWNIAIDEPVTGSKKISIIVTWQDGGVQKQLVFNAVKSSI
ncbi:MAG: prepilin-type N-terminal cleavage/methylation domain-containing protein [Proteobacteria bacterium]|nr:prepilin-type N-terminal cleavage/methylation domain-containing protein [Pseudomonadota bacterium]MBU1582584.1 prepilin-type N-terminal cleavage/methylation domain-containing protein [Pseudomonadota bacterium]MBU2455481.1 prepilin-type N-terminal cleavage/methylation domain-containing protein [Pseudomonadota bacterium]MBU2630211.1 prepilin-type N-terminal cleavage/methylation domain-containing protein [Pseudomonadota bacterium]